MADSYVWTSADGVVIDLSDTSAGLSVLARGTTGFRGLRHEFTTSKFAGVDGDSVQAIRAGSNAPTLGMLLEASSEDDFIDRSRALVRAMRPRVNGQPAPGQLTVTRTGRTPRTLRCFVTEGLEGDEDPGSVLPGAWWRFQLKFLAPDPWWVGPLQYVNVGLAAPSLFFPFFPLNLSASTVQGQFIVDLSESDAPSYPVWTITGPGDSLVLTNNTTGRTIEVNSPVADNQTIVIDTRPGMQSVRSGSGTNLMHTLASDPALWSLVEGVQQVTALLTNAGPNSRISGAFEPKFAGI